MSTPDWLDELERLPRDRWGYKRHQFFVAGPDGEPRRGGMTVGMFPMLGQSYREETTAQVVAAHNALPRLLAIARAARAHVERCHVPPDGCDLCRALGASEVDDDG